MSKRHLAVYTAIWRWHFYAGMIAAPVIFLVTLTGTIYIWAPEWEVTVNRDLFIATPNTGHRGSLDEQARTVHAAYPDAHLQLFAIHGPGRTDRYHWRTAAGVHRYVYVNPYTGEIQGTRIHQHSLMPIMRDAHRNLLAGTVGRVLVELATSWSLVLLLTGIVLWWPKKLATVAGVWGLRLRGVKPYFFWRDLHAVPSLYISPIAIIIVFTGLFYTLGSGTLMKLGVLATTDLRDRLRNPPMQPAPEGMRPATRDQVLRAVRTVTDSAQLVMIAPEADVDIPGTTEHRHITPDQAAEAPAAVFERPWFIETGNKDDPPSRMILQVDPYTAEVVQTIRFAEVGPVAQAAAYFYPLHVGSIGGWPTKVLATLACLLIMAMTVTGAVMWWARRPPGRSGFMPLPIRYHWPTRWWIAIAVAGVVMPLFAASFVAVLAIEHARSLLHRRQAASRQSA